ncbi:hypothetical protein EVB81_013 [Rhizobium phage RHph_I46]|uniref:Uncharacterized protein n=1 Tax=Rhizobium phage RHph_I1_9 TaxID=2509729 RepID=A0A7S5REQ3_9CAUD|nr:hypothetical protein PP936_gp013 [Rhizobium phage RHph_I1_9]QIG69582.1 hypothetical protein EVB81_013 [Rhizobium phage RHph_I46]QIG70863.1 hypothetical protein EVB92_013 [Rhizobium phage RHph_I9]QIG73450.1 hypothetical protein EVC04_013 [Rhizobium phage RHph_I1_9]QIG76202.1 hypothetical protein EVC25_013 [Rhizobium phage RHph_I34]
MATTTFSQEVTSTSWVLAIDGTTYSKAIIGTGMCSTQIAYAIASSLPADNSTQYDIIMKYESKYIDLAATDKIYVRKVRPRDGKIKAVLTSRA